MQTREEFLTALGEYRDRWGMVHPTKEVNTQNGLIYTAYSYAILKLRGWENFSDALVFDAIESQCESTPGLIHRAPLNCLQASIDDYLGVVAMSAILSSPGASYRVLAYGRAHHLKLGPFKLPYFYNTECPGTQLKRNGSKNWDAYFGRFIILILLLKWSAEEKKTWLQKLVFKLNLWWESTTTNQSNQDRLMMLFLKCVAFSPESLGKCEDRLKRRGVSIQKAFESYFGSAHPFSKALQSRQS